MTSTPRTRLALAALALAALGLGACGGDDDGGGSPFGGGAQDDDGSDDGDDGSPDDSQSPDDTTGGDGTETTSGDGEGDSDGDGEGSDDLGSCHVKVTGDVESEWTSGGGFMSIGYGPWAPEAYSDSTFVLDETYFIINCTGEGSDYVGFTAGGEQGVPMEPATYIFPADGGVVGSSSTEQVQVIIGLNGPDTVWEVGAEGTLVITEFDENHVAGTFELPVTDALADMTGVDNGDAMIVGEFDLANPY